MKKILTIIAASLALASGLLLSSCSDDDDEFFGPSNTWCEAPITKDNLDGTKETLGYIAAVYCDEDYESNGTGSSQLKNGEKLEAGITVVIWGNASASDDSIADSILKGLSSTTYIKKTFPKANNTEISDGADDSSKKNVKGSRAVWSAAYIFNKDLHNVEKQKKLPEAPIPLVSSSYSDASETVQNFSWKSVLKQYLINSL